MACAKAIARAAEAAAIATKNVKRAADAMADATVIVGSLAASSVGSQPQPAFASS